MSQKLNTIFWNSAAAHPDHNAVLSCAADGMCKEVTYHDLGREASRVGEAVRQHITRAPQGSRDERQDEHGVPRRGTQGESHDHAVVIGVLCSGVEAVACILGTLSSCAYWYVSPQYTCKEVNELAKRIGPEMMLVEESLLPSVAGITTAFLETLHVFGTQFRLLAIKGNKKSSSFLKRNRMEGLAYVVPTSGSTGTPKCVYVPHDCVMPNIKDLSSLFELTSQDKILCAAPLTFDPSVIDLFLAFTVSASLVMVPPTLLRTPKALLKLLVEQRVTVMQATPTLLLSLGRDSVSESLLCRGGHLRVLALGGEVFPSAGILRECVGDGCETRIFNLYGLTEVSCWASVEEWVPGGTSTPPVVDQTPIGIPLSLTEITVLKEGGEKAEEGEKGEIYVGGSKRLCVVDDRDDSTMEGYMRPTGDEGLIAGGHIYCLGRMDNQVKRNGQRISLAEIESVCSGVCFVSQCRVVSYPRGTLVAYVCLCDREKTAEDVWKHLRGSLSPWKLPDEVVLVNIFPFNDHGKVDIQTLLSLKPPSSHFQTHTQTLEDFVKDLWKRTLVCESVGDQDRFIECGGNSLTAMQFAVAVAEFVDFEIPELLDVLLHDTFSRTLKVVRECQLSRKTAESNNSVSEVAENSHFERNENLSKKSKNNHIERTESLPKRTENNNTKGNENLHKGIKSNHTERIESLPKRKKNNHTNKNDNMPKGTVTDTCNNSSHTANSTNPAVTKMVLGDKLSLAHQILENTAIQGQTTTDEGQNTADEDPYTIRQDQNAIVSTVSRRGLQERVSATLHQLLPHTNTLKWKYNLGKCIDSSPLLIECADGKTLIFVGSHSHRFACLDAVSGDEVWCHCLGDRVESSPCVSLDGSAVYVGCYDYHLYCLRVHDGSIVWKYRTAGEVKSSPVVDVRTGCVLFGSHDRHLYCLHTNGEVNWMCEVSKGSIFSSPCIAEGTVIAATLDGVACGVDSNSGAVRWKVALHKPIFCSPAVYSQGVVFGTVDGQIMSYSLGGTLLWKFKTEGNVFSSPYVLKLKDGPEIIAIGSHDSCIYFLSHSGKVIAKYAASSPVYATPFLYPTENKQMVLAVVCETHGKCTVLSMRLNSKETSVVVVEEIWERQFAGEIFASPICFKGKLYVGCRDDFLYCFDSAS